MLSSCELTYSSWISRARPDWEVNVYWKCLLESCLYINLLEHIRAVKYVVNIVWNNPFQLDYRAGFVSPNSSYLFSGSQLDSLSKREHNTPLWRNWVFVSYLLLSFVSLFSLWGHECVSVLTVQLRRGLSIWCSLINFNLNEFIKNSRRNLAETTSYLYAIISVMTRK